MIKEFWKEKQMKIDHGNGGARINEGVDEQHGGAGINNSGAK